MTVTADTTTLESGVRSYSRTWPATFERAKGSFLYTPEGEEYLDFFTGAGVMNYGHNNTILKEALLRYLTEDNIVHSLDMLTTAREDFLTTFTDQILRPRGLDHTVMFPGPGGANAVEAALKLARKITGRESIVNFTNAFHGMTLGALAVTGNSMKRGGAGIPLVHATPMPYDDYFDGDVPDFVYFERMLSDSGSGLNKPAAVIVETVQGEGGVNTARLEWLRQLSEVCHKHEILLIVDDIQVGCGRTGGFFSFEEAGIVPDIICLSKAISGYGLPLALTLLRPELDVWDPGEHNGTFRGFAPAFVTAAEAIRTYWSDNALEQSTLTKGAFVEATLNSIVAKHPEGELTAKGRGLIRGLEFADPDKAAQTCRNAFDAGLLVETSGPRDEVIKLLPPLTISEDELTRGLSLLRNAATDALD
ncbi:diaminobutyrate--2-oxoglutarate transaminase [Flexivirga sp.]|uniref:diaminobutyrate--2-oxoglutarate transaminase n=1 Tax=Flexivirga sp. TaxID=1962927 RepID=UPI003F7EF8DB